MKTYFFKTLKKAAIVALIFAGVALIQTCDQNDPYLQPKQKNQPRQWTAEEIDRINRINNLGSHDADTDIHWTYKK